MLQTLQVLFTPAVLDRVVLCANHVLSRDGVATQRLQAHVGRSLRVNVEGWPDFLPPWPALALRITPAGLFERAEGPAAPDGAGAPVVADLQLWLDASQPLELARRLAAGEGPAVRVEGDAQLASEVNWLVTHVRWDAAADLERLVGPGAAHALASLAAAVLAAVSPRGGAR
ncbi:MAG: hypothetical protein RI988_1301 [Pseudomonadota bacterium]|jgi:ubiquinone biosynthesis protein UbiJ